jgi:hypothetical protein
MENIPPQQFVKGGDVTASGGNAGPHGKGGDFTMIGGTIKGGDAVMIAPVENAKPIQPVQPFWSHPLVNWLLGIIGLVIMALVTYALQ